MAGRGLKINQVWVLEHVVCFERKRGRKRCGVCVGVETKGVWYLLCGSRDKGCVF